MRRIFSKNEFLNYFVSIVLTTLFLVIASFPQGDFKPRDADEEHGWRLYNQYKESKKKETELNKRIPQLRGDITDASHSILGGLGADSSDVAEKNKALQQLKTEQEKQRNLEAAWQKKFYWRYGDLKDSDKMIYDPKTKQNMDKIQFALIYFPFNSENKESKISRYIDWEAKWGSIKITIVGIQNLKTTSVGSGTKFTADARPAEKVKIEGLIKTNTPEGKAGQITNLEGEIIDTSYSDYQVQINIKSNNSILYTLSPKISGQGGEAKFSYLVELGKLPNTKNLTLEVTVSGGKAEFGRGFVTGNVQITTSDDIPVAPTTSLSQSKSGNKISTTKGRVDIFRDGKTLNPADSNLQTGDQIKTANGSAATLKIADLVNLILGANSWLGINNDSKTSPMLKLFGGNAKISLPKMVTGTNLKIEMSQALVTVKGTSFELWENGERSVIKVEEGVVEFRHKNMGAVTNVSAGQSFVSTQQGLGMILGTQQMQPSEEKLIFSTGNDYGVLNGGTSPSFTLRQAVTVTYIMTYHWNNGSGTKGGTITLKKNNGEIFGPWKVNVRNNVYWEVTPQVTLMPGTYTVIDSDPSTWAQNPQSGGKGHTIIKGMVLPN